MVVILIIGILLSVSIPTFLGARNRAADSAATAHLRTAANTAYPLTDFGTNFTAATPGALALDEPSLEFTVGSRPSSGSDVVSVDSSRPTQWSGVILSGSGRCFGVVLQVGGRAFYESPSCRADRVNTEWDGSSGYVPRPPDPQIDGQATYPGDVPDSTSFAPNQEYRSDDELFVFFESALVLDSDLTVAGVTIPAGTSVCSHIVWYDPSFTTDVSASIDFGAPILLGAGRRSDLQATDQFAIAGVNYFNYNRPWYDGDTFSFTGSVGQFTALAIGGNADMIRILTDCG